MNISILSSRKSLFNALNSDTIGLLAAIGIVKSKPFLPDARMKAILTEAVAVGNATARVDLFTSRIKERFFYPDSAWFTVYFCGNHEFLLDGVPSIDARIAYWYFANGISPAMVLKMVGVGSQYAAAMVNSQGKPLDGSKTYKVHLPPNVPVKDFWSFVVYDNQTRTMLQTDQQFPSISNNTKGIVINADTSVDVWFGRPRLKVMRPTGCRRFPAKAGSLSFACMGRFNPGSTRPGDQER